MKFFTIAILLLSAVLCYLSAGVSAGNVSWGKRGPMDRVLARDIVQKKAGWFSKKKLNVVFPPKGHQSFNRLSEINVMDLGGHENYATAELVEGGPGEYTATIKIKSQKRKPIDMVIEYYGQ